MEQTPQTTLTKDPRAGEALTVRRLFTQAGRASVRRPSSGSRARAAVGSFRQDGVEFPTTWSQNATNIVAQKYFRGQLDSPTRERSVKQMIGRVAGTIADWGRERGYFASVEDGDAFEAELTYILLHQMAAFNSPVWFNVRLRGAARSARPASSSASRTRWSRSSTGTPRRAGSSAAVPARASTCRRSAARWSRWPRAAPPAGRSPSCAAPTRGPARSSPAARRAARPRWSCSTSTTRTSASSSGARPRRRTRPPRCATPASTCRSTATASTRSSTRTPTTRSASPTSSCTRSRTTRTGT